MTSKVNTDVAAAVASLAALLALYALHAAGLVPSGSVAAFTDELVTTLSNRDLNQEGREALSAGYYEGLINEGSRLGSMNRLVTDTRAVPGTGRQLDRQRVETFRLYELTPSSEIQDYDDERARYRLKTNGAGMADKEYSHTRPDGVRRLALFGDSVTRGQGAPFQGNYEALLEDHLNAGAGAEPSYEILNFSVGSYSLMQMMDAALERATPWAPDVYVVALTDRCVYRRWGDHLAQLLSAGIDLKYDYLRDVVRQAGLQASDSRGVVAAKLARFRIPTIRWALDKVKRHAERQNAQVLVLFVPTADDPALLREEFLGVPEAIQELGLPVVDLLDTFANVPDRGTIRVADNDRHPNAAGHQMLFERLSEAIRTRPEIRQVVLGGT